MNVGGKIAVKSIGAPGAKGPEVISAKPNTMPNSVPKLAASVGKAKLGFELSKTKMLSVRVESS